MQSATNLISFLESVESHWSGSPPPKFSERSSCTLFYIFLASLVLHSLHHIAYNQRYISHLEFSQARSNFLQLEPHDEHVVSETVTGLAYISS